MAKIVSDEIEIRAHWPLSRFGSHRVSYGIPLMTAAFLFLGVLLGLFLLGGPDPSILTLVWAPIMAIVFTTWGASYYDGTVIVAKREYVALKRWFRQPAVVAIAEVARLVRLTVDEPTQYGTAPRPAVFFFSRDGRCILSLFTTRFDDRDLGFLWATIGIQPEGSLDEHVHVLKLNERFPGAFTRAA